MSARYQLPEVTLTKSEYYKALRVGSTRVRDVFIGNREDKKNTPDIYFVENHILGALCEVAFAKLMGIQFDPDTKIGSRDFPNAEIRGTKYTGGKLLMYESDLDATPYLLMIHVNQFTFALAGGVMGAKGKLQKYWDNTMPIPCLAVPQSEFDIFPEIPLKLNPLEDF